MKLTFLGTGAAYYPVLGSTSAFFTADDILYLIDCGETTFARLFEKIELYKASEVYVLLTHIHADHFGSLGSFTSYCKNVLEKKVTIVSPDENVVKVLAMTGLTLQDYTYDNDFTKTFPGNIKITPVDVIHDPSMGCYGFYLDDGQEIIYYGGDSCGMPDGLMEKIKDGTVSVAYQEVTYETKFSAGHTCLEQLCQLVPEELRDKFVCMHFGSDFLDLVESCGFEIAKAE